MIRQFKQQYGNATNETVLELFQQINLGENYTASEDNFVSWVMDSGIDVSNMTEEHLTEMFDWVDGNDD